MEEILKNLENLSNCDKNQVIQNLIIKRRKEIICLISQNNIYSKNNDIENIDSTRKSIKKIKNEISILQKLKQESVTPNNSKVKIKREKEEKISLNKAELDFLGEYISGNHMETLTNFDCLDESLLEHLLQLKQTYVTNKKMINKKVKNIKKSIKILSDFSTEKNKKLNEMLDINLKLKKIISKIIKYLDKLIKIEFKKRNSLTRKEKRLIGTLFADKLEVVGEKTVKDYTIQELYSTYYELIFKDRDLNEIKDLLERYPDLFLLKNKKKLFYELILDRYSNILLNKNYIGNSEKCKQNKEELEYYKKIIVKYLSYGFENNKSIIRDLTIRKINRIINIINKNNIYIDKSSEILNQVKYFQEIIHLENAQNGDLVKEINNEYIFSIDSEGTQIIEDALSVKKDKDNYYINFYIPDLVSFIPLHSILGKNALERYKNNKYAFPYDIVKFFKLNQGRKKRVIGYHFVYDSNGFLKDLRIEKNIVKLYNSYTFNQFDELFMNGDINASNIKELFELISNKNIENINYSSSTILSFLIQNAGINLGKYLGARNRNCIYKDISDGKTHLIWSDNDYVEFTSPLRSYVSFLNQHITFNENVNDLTDKCDAINQKVKK